MAELPTERVAPASTEERPKRVSKTTHARDFVSECKQFHSKMEAYLATITPGTEEYVRAELQLEVSRSYTNKLISIVGDPDKTKAVKGFEAFNEDEPGVGGYIQTLGAKGTPRRDSIEALLLLLRTGYTGNRDELLEELGDRWKLYPGSFSPTISKLRDAGWVIETGDTSLTPSGAKGYVFAISPQFDWSEWDEQHPDQEAETLQVVGGEVSE